MTKVDVNSLTSKTIKKELDRTKYNSKFSNILKSTSYVLIIIAALGGLLAMFVTPVLQISSNAMSPYYNNGDIVVAIKSKKISSGDVIAFYYGNKILVSRVVAVAADNITIDKNGSVYVNGILFDDEYASNKDTISNDIKYPYQVPSESYFVLNDDRKVLSDSRVLEIGAVKKEDLIGKIIFKVFKGD